MNQTTGTSSFARSVYAEEIEKEEKRRAQFEPTPEDFADPRFDAVWSVIKTWDVPHGGDLWSEATGNDVVMILRAIDALAPSGRQEPEP